MWANNKWTHFDYFCLNILHDYCWIDIETEIGNILNKDALNFEPTYTIEDGIKEIINNLEKGKYNNPNEFSDSYGNYKINNEIIV